MSGYDYALTNRLVALKATRLGLTAQGEPVPEKLTQDINDLTAAVERAQTDRLLERSTDRAPLEFPEITAPGSQRGEGLLKPSEAATWAQCLGSVSRKFEQTQARENVQVAIEKIEAPIGHQCGLDLLPLQDSLAPYQVRVVEEYRELTRKLEALGAFIRSPEYLKLSAREGSLLCQQAQAMAEYQRILRKRIEGFTS